MDTTSDGIPPPNGGSPEPPTDEQATPRVVVRRSEPRPEDQPPSTYAGLEQMSESELDWPMDDGPGPPPPQRSILQPFLVGLLLGIGLATVSIVSFLTLRQDPEEVTTPATVSVPATVAETPQTVTTIELSTTTVPAPPETSPLLDAIGEPISIEELSLATNGIGPLAVGDDGNQVVGRLVATFGQPDSDTGTVIATGAFGACPGTPVRVVRWGPLAVIVTDPEATPVFAGYRLDLAFGNLESRSAELNTVSGLQVGNTIETLESIYTGFNINYDVVGDTGLVFRLSTESGGLLLWGPVTSAELDGKVSGIYSPDVCADQ